MTAAVILRVLCALAALVILVTVAERMFPLRSVARDRWEWELRPAGRFPRIDRAGWAQVAVFNVLGAGIGGLLRLAVGLCRPRRLSAVLANGTTRAMATASHQLFDSESAADIYAATWLRDTPVRPRRIRGPVLPALMLRRILRRGYIPLLSVTVALVAAAVGPAAGAWGRGLLILCWAVPAAAVWRATRLRIPGEGWWRWLRQWSRCLSADCCGAAPASTTTSASRRPDCSAFRPGCWATGHRDGSRWCRRWSPQ